MTSKMKEARALLDPDPASLAERRRDAASTQKLT